IWENSLRTHGCYNFSHPFRAFRQDLIVMPRRLAHHLPNFRNERRCDLLVEKITHGVDKDLAWFAPTLRDFKRIPIFTDHSIPDCPASRLPSEACVLFYAHSL